MIVNDDATDAPQQGHPARDQCDADHAGPAKYAGHRVRPRTVFYSQHEDELDQQDQQKHHPAANEACCMEPDRFA
jgi:hypothetical protein